MSKGVLIAAAGAIAAVAVGAIAAQIQMPQQSVPGQTKTPPAKAWPAAKATGKTTPGPPSAAAAQDQQIEAAIKAKLAKSKIGKDGFRVRVQGGVAFWEGSTSVVQHKGSATRMAKSAGAKAVVNNIKVSDAAKAKATENLDQGRRRAQVKRSDPRSARSQQ